MNCSLSCAPATSPGRVRARAAISLGPASDADIQRFEEPEYSSIGERTFAKIKASLRALYTDGGVPENVRRGILEASVRAPQRWHEDAIQPRTPAATSPDRGLRHALIPGFNEEIVEALDSDNEDIRTKRSSRPEAPRQWLAPWPRVVALVPSRKTPKHLLLAVIEAVASIRPPEAPEILDDLLDSGDEEYVAAVEELWRSRRDRTTTNRG